MGRPDVRPTSPAAPVLLNDDIDECVLHDDDLFRCFSPDHLLNTRVCHRDTFHGGFVGIGVDLFTRSDPELGGLQLSRFKLRPVIEEAAELLSEKLRKRQIRFSTRVEADEPLLHADRDKIQQVFINLLSNAIKFNHDGGTIAVTVKTGPPGFVMVDVEDDGRGIPQDDQSRIFDRNYQVLRDSSSTPEGSGIGLAIVRDILRLHGCRIGVESQEGSGTRFHFTLPLSEDVLSTSEADTSIEPPAPTEVSPRPRFRIIRRG